MVFLSNFLCWVYFFLYKNIHFPFLTDTLSWHLLSSPPPTEGIKLSAPLMTRARRTALVLCLRVGRRVGVLQADSFWRLMNLIGDWVLNLVVFWGWVPIRMDPYSYVYVYRPEGNGWQVLSTFQQFLKQDGTVDSHSWLIFHYCKTAHLSINPHWAKMAPQRGELTSLPLDE